MPVTRAFLFYINDDMESYFLNSMEIFHFDLQLENPTLNSKVTQGLRYWL